MMAHAAPALPRLSRASVIADPEAEAVAEVKNTA